MHDDIYWVVKKLIQIIDKTQCCGCTACYNACPVKCVIMKPDEEGFLYPSVDLERCVHCGMCEKVCPILHKENHIEKTEGYIIRCKDKNIVEESTSGGAFTVFSTYLMSRGYVVYGAGYDKDMQVVCKKASKPEELKEMRGSKFVQSTLGTTFQAVKKELNEGQKILFTGTPCQISGLISYLGGKNKNLFCIDFVCRGVPSPGLWKNYVTMMEKKYGSKMIGARFKHKTYGYHATTMKVDFKNGKQWYGSGRVDPMMKAFVTELASRPSCHQCAFKGVERQSDITIFDCYEYTKITGQKDDDKGYSSMFVHTEKGREVLQALKPQIIWREEPIDQLVTKNGIMVYNSAKPNEKRDEFYRAVAKMPIDQAIQKISPITFKDYILEFGKSVLFHMGLVQIARKFRKRKGIEINEK